MYHPFNATDDELTTLIKEFVPSSSDKVSPAQAVIDPLAEKYAPELKAKVSTKTLARSIDVLLLGPALIYSGTGRKLPGPLATMLVLTGMGTILVNLGELLDETDS